MAMVNLHHLTGHDRSILFGHRGSSLFQSDLAEPSPCNQAVSGLDRSTNQARGRRQRPRSSVGCPGFVSLELRHPKWAEAFRPFPDSPLRCNEPTKPCGNGVPTDGVTGQSRQYARELFCSSLRRTIKAVAPRSPDSQSAVSGWRKIRRWRRAPWPGSPG
jgi:hypothetical protein